MLYVVCGSLKGIMRIDVLTLFPEMFDGPMGHSIPARAQDKGLVELCYTNFRDFGEGNYKKVDDNTVTRTVVTTYIKKTLEDEEALNSLSRRGNVYICNPCGDDEAFIERVLCIQDWFLEQGVEGLEGLLEGY